MVGASAARPWMINKNKNDDDGDDCMPLSPAFEVWSIMVHSDMLPQVIRVSFWYILWCIYIYIFVFYGELTHLFICVFCGCSVYFNVLSISF